MLLNIYITLVVLLNMQETSIEAYNSIQVSLGKRQKNVHDMIKKNGSVTNRELSTLLQIPINQITPRTNELVKMGLVIQDGKVKDLLTNRSAMLWKLSNYQ